MKDSVFSVGIDGFMKTNTIDFNFIFPITDRRFTSSASNFTDLYISGRTEIGKINKIKTTHIKSITYWGKQRDSSSVDISELLRFLRPDIYDEILQATKAHAEKRYGKLL